MEKIDFVVLWVDGSDPKWITERAKFLPNENASGTAVNRFRDWDLMRYWFRGIEKFAPWANRIFFVTWGHYPAWLNLDHPKLKIVKHEDYIPAEYLPTYNSNVIELNLHRIRELNEHFVLFNDDMFLTNKVAEHDFFRDGIPCDTIRMGTISSESLENTFPHTLLNCSAIINKHYCQREVIKKHWKKFFSIKYGVDLWRNFSMAPYRYFSSFYDTHLMTSHLKKTFFEIWEKESTVLDNCSKQRFRSCYDVTHWLMKWWRYCKGEVYPRRTNWGRCFELGKDTGIFESIEKQRYKAVCVNDSDPNLDFEWHQRKLIAAFEAILPEKSSFEK